jgi:hypothetical protein
VSKELVSLSASSNQFLNDDNHLNTVAVKELEDKIQAIVKGLPVTNAKGKVIKMPIPEKTFTVNRRKRQEKFDSAKHKRGDLNYLAKRALPVKQTKRLTDRGAIRNMAMLTIYPADKMEKAYGEDPFLKLRKTIKLAVSAFEKHMKRADKTKESVKTQKTKIRDASNELFGKAIAAFKKVLKSTNVDMDKDLIESSGMGGKTVLLKLDKELVVSIGKSDMTKFKAAKQKLIDAENGVEPKKGFGAKKTVGKKASKEEKTSKKVKKASKEEKVVKKAKKADKTDGKKKLKKKPK